MSSIVLRASGSATADEVWDRYLDTRRWSDWSPQIRSVSTSSGPFLVPGLTGSVHSFAGVSASFVVESVDLADRIWSWRAAVGPVRVELTHGVSGRDGGSATWLRVRGALPIITSYAPLAYLAIRRLVRA